MNKKNHKLLIIFIIIIIFGGIYLYFFSNSNTEAATDTTTSTDSPLSSSVKDSADATASTTDLQSDTAFISSLLSLNKIEVDLKLFDDKTFKSLKDNSVNFDTISPGRSNPFSYNSN